MRPRTVRAVRAALFEAAFVVLGIVLALAANDWYEQRVQRERADAALHEIVLELGSNREAVGEALAYHQALLDTLRGAQRGGAPPDPRVFTRGFVAPAQLSRTAWQSASETGALMHMDYHTVLRLSNLYAQADRYEDQSRSIGQILYGALYRGGPTGVVSNASNLASLIGTFSYRERQLMELYARTLPELPAAEPSR